MNETLMIVTLHRDVFYNGVSEPVSLEAGDTLTRRIPDDNSFLWHPAPKPGEPNDVERMDWLVANMDRFFGSKYHVVAKFNGLRGAIDAAMQELR